MSRWSPEPMSGMPQLRWRDHVRIALTPSGIGLARASRGWNTGFGPSQWIPVANAAGAHPGAGASGASTDAATMVEALIRALAESRWRHAEAQIVLSGAFVRYTLVPWSASLSADAERRAYAQLEFESLYGERARQWVVSLDDAAPGEPAPACAIEGALLEGVRVACAGASLRLTACAPLFATVVREQRVPLAAPRTALALIEGGRLTLGLFTRGHWRLLINTRPANGAAGAVAAELQQALAQGVIEATGTLVVVHGDGRLGAPSADRDAQWPAQIAGWNVVLRAEPGRPTASMQWPDAVRSSDSTSPVRPTAGAVSGMPAVIRRGARAAQALARR